MITQIYNIPDPRLEEVWFLFCKERIDKAIASKDVDCAIQLIYEWAGLICKKLNIRNEHNWKFFKRNIIRKYFGENYMKRKYNGGWDYHEVLNFIQKYPDLNFRISIFPKDIACHSQSIPLPKNQYSLWENILSGLDNSCEAEVFQQASDESSICFRRFSTLFGEVIRYEAGFGQAMYVFEEEQGKHIILSATSESNNQYTYYSDSNYSNELYLKLNDLISTYDYHLHIKSKSICRKIGIEWLSIEGYYSKENPSDLIVVDIDLPFDYVFMLK
jgi:hypothetical protein